jgi:predicted permease
MLNLSTYLVIVLLMIVAVIFGMGTFLLINKKTKLNNPFNLLVNKKNNQLLKTLISFKNPFIYVFISIVLMSIFILNLFKTQKVSKQVNAKEIEN